MSSPDKPRSAIVEPGADERVVVGRAGEGLPLGPPAVDHIGLAGIGATVVAGVRADQHIVEPIAVHVARAGHLTEAIPRDIALDDEPLIGREAGKVDIGELARMAVDQIDRTSVHPIPIVECGADKQIVEIRRR